ncbi:response regulator transcription factor [Galbibacter sp. BG1]
MSSFLKIVFLLISLHGFSHNNLINTEHLPQNSIGYITIGNDTIHYKKSDEFSTLYSIDNDTQITWQKFDNYVNSIENQVKITNYDFLKEANNYTKDSTKILLVKLFSIKTLNEKKLLDDDILDNQTYYADLLQKLKSSDLDPSYYLFLERRFNSLQLKDKEKNYALSIGFNILAIVLIIGMGYRICQLRFSVKKSENPSLSKQEETIKNLIISGKSNKEIASELYISLSTVKTHITSIYSKLNVSGRKELLAIN